MFFWGNSEIEKLINEDVPYFDLTTHIMGIEDLASGIRYKTRENSVICGSEEVLLVFKQMGIESSGGVKSGSQLTPGEVIIEGAGSAGAVHRAWKVCVNILEYASGIATKTRHFVDNARSVNPEINICVTRKIFPGTKKLAVKAAMCGGAVPHRLGLSETILIFDEHIRFLGGMDKLRHTIEEIKKHSGEKKIEIEAHSMEDALRFAEFGVDLIQVDKMECSSLGKLVGLVKEINPLIKVAAAGGVNLENAGDYAATGVDILVTSAMYHGKPADIKAEITPL